MFTRRLRARAFGSLLLLFTLVGLPRPSAAQQGGEREMVLTFDDLPMTGGSLCDTALVWYVTERLTDYLEEHSIPSLGLATPGRDCITPELLGATLREWAAADAEIGNHTANHPDLNGTPLEAYLENLDRGQRLIDDVIANPRRWFRPPYLHMGDEAVKKAGLERHLADRDYRLAPVTIDNQEWVYAAVYSDARARGDAELARRIADGYLEHLEESMEFYEELSDRVFGRQIPQTLLLHANLLNADLIDRIDEMLGDRGYRYIEMAEAVADPAYGSADEYVGPRGLSWLQRWALARDVSIPDEPREAEWVAEEYDLIGQERDGGGGYEEVGGSTGSAGDAAAGQESSEVQAIRAASRAFSDAYVRGDMDALMALYTPYAVLLPPERDVQGRAAIGRYFAPGPNRVNVSHGMESDSVSISGDLATDVGTWTNTWRIGDGPVQSASGRYLVVWGRGADGTWRMRYDMWHRPVSR